MEDDVFLSHPTDETIRECHLCAWYHARWQGCKDEQDTVPALVELTAGRKIEMLGEPGERGIGRASGARQEGILSQTR